MNPLEQLALSNRSLPIAQGLKAGGSSAWTLLRKAADETRSTAVQAADATLAFAVAAGVTYAIRGFVVITQARDDIGCNLRFNGPAITWLDIETAIQRVRTAGAQVGTGTNLQNNDLDDYATINSYTINATAGATTAASNNRYRFNGLFMPSASGTFSIDWWPQSVPLGNATMKKGSYLEYSSLT